MAVPDPAFIYRFMHVDNLCLQQGGMPAPNYTLNDLELLR